MAAAIDMLVSRMIKQGSGPPADSTHGYFRVSEGENAESCDQQERACRKKAKELGLSIDETYRDEGITGSRHNRPAYQRMLAAAQRGEFSTLLLWKQNRLGRDQPETERAMRALESLGIRLITVDGYDTHGSPLKTRKLTRVIKGAMDEAYLDELREDTWRGLESQFDKGFWCGGRVYGYTLVEVTSESETDAYGRPKRVGTRLEIDALQAEIVREIFEKYADGSSPQRIAAQLNQRTVPSPGSTWARTKRRCNGWARSAVWQMLRNPLYAGTYLWNLREMLSTGEGRRARRRPETDWKGSFGNAPHLAIIEPGLWQRVQERLSANRGKSPDMRLKSGGRPAYVLSGVLQCGQCGAHFIMDSATHYRCGSVVDGKACNNSIRVRRDLAERLILRPVLEELLSPEMAAEMAKEMRAYYQERLVDARAQASKAPAEVQDLEKRIARLRKRLKHGDPDLTAEEILIIIEKAERRRSELLTARPDATRIDKALRELPTAAALYRAQIDLGLRGNRDEAARARLAIKRLTGEKIRLVPADGGGHLIAHLEFQPAVLLADAGSVGSGGSIRSLTCVRYLD